MKRVRVWYQDDKRISLSFMCFKCLLCVYEEVRVKSRMRKVVSLLFFSFLFSCVCVEKCEFFDACGGKNKKKIQKVQTPKQKRERERDTD